MKTVKLIAFLALSGIALSFSVAREQINYPIKNYDGSGIVWKSQEIDLGKIPQGKPVTVQFEFSNKAKEPVIISNVTTSCGCTVADYSKKPIMKNEKSTIKVTYNAANAGAFSKDITVILANEETQVLHLKGIVI
jgi:Protein of unknown function (DUF1573)